MPRPMPDWLVVARREFLERVRTWWFVIVTLLGPIGMAGIIVVPAWLSVESAKKGVHIQVVDATQRIDQEVLDAAVTLAKTHYEMELLPLSQNDLAEIAEHDGELPERLVKSLRKRILDREIDGYLVIPADAFEGGTARYNGVNATSQIVKAKLYEVLYRAVLSIRVAEFAKKHNIENNEEVAVLLKPVPIDTQQDTGEGEVTSGQATFIIGYTVMFILYMAILLYAVNVLRSVVQEKTSRVVEIMVSAVKPRALMLGKILGVGSVGLFQLSIWAAIALLLIRYRAQVLGLFGVSGAGAFDIPSLTVGAVILILTYFLLGYFFYSALYAAIGAMVNSEQEAQQAQTPVVILLIIPVVCVQLVANDPRGHIADVLTMIPFSSPVLMPMRYLLGGASALDLIFSLVILLLSMYVAVFLASRIYRVGILMYGKRPSLREVGRWIRHE